MAGGREGGREERRGQETRSSSGRAEEASSAGLARVIS
jgi:hypothetical protein